MSFQEKFQQFKAHPFTRDVAVLQIAQVAARAISLASAFFFARILGPEQYGFYGLVIALAGTINIFQEFGIGQGTVNLLAQARSTGDQNESRQILKFFAIMSALILVTTGTAGFLLAPYLGEKFYHNTYLGALASIAVATSALTFFFPLATICLQVARRIAAYATVDTLNKIFNALVPLFLVILGFGVFGIMAGQFWAMIVMSLIGFAVYLRLASQDDFYPNFSGLLRQKWSLAKFREYFKGKGIFQCSEKSRIGKRIFEEC